MFELVVLLLLSHMWGVHRNLLIVAPYEVVSASPAVSCVSGSSNLDSFRDHDENYPSLTNKPNQTKQMNEIVSIK